jgi:hypothetical protein
MRETRRIPTHTAPAYPRDDCGTERAGSDVLPFARCREAGLRGRLCNAFETVRAWELATARSVPTRPRPCSTAERPGDFFFPFFSHTIFSTYSSSIVNDPSAGSPTETLLRLLLPLDSQVRHSSRHSGATRSRTGTNPRISLNHPIGSSDGRCVQRAGT